MKLSTFIILFVSVIISFLFFVEMKEPGTLRDAIFSEAPEALDRNGPPAPYEGYWSNEAAADYAVGNYPE
jgi:hypothetical protein